jgi:phage shock protein C
MARKRLYRSVKDKKIAGVCGGLAKYFNIDPAIVRVVFLFSALLWGASIVLYLVCWVCVPSEGGPDKK